MNLTINGKQVTAEAGETILKCASRNGIAIPHLCTHPALPPFGACRMCVVEIEGMRGFPASCTTPCAEGMVVQTNTEALRELRRNTLALIMLEHPSACLVCDKRDLCDKYRPKSEKVGRTSGCHTCNNKEVCEVRVLSAELGLTSLPVPPRYHARPIERANPFMDRDLNLCILCGRCVRICKHHHGKSVIDFVGRSSHTYIGEAFGRTLSEADCRYCGSCVDVCPTGTLADRYAKWYGRPDAERTTTCLYCGEACALNARTKEGKVVSAAPAGDNVPLCLLGRFCISELLNGPDRVVTPKVRITKGLRPVTWEEATAAVAEKLAPYAGASFALVCDTTTPLEDRYVLKKFATEAMKGGLYIEIEPDDRGVSKTTLPAGVKAALVTGNYLDDASLDALEVLIVQDMYETAPVERAYAILPPAVFTEVDGTIKDMTGALRPLFKASKAPGDAKPEWEIAAGLAKALGATGFDYANAAAIAAEMGLGDATLFTDRDKLPEPARDPRLHRTGFRGHKLADHVTGLAELHLKGAPAPEAIPEPIAREKTKFEILAKEEIAPNTHEIVVYAPDIAAKAQPGQFCIVMADSTSERVPYTLCDWDKEAGTITLVVLEKGQSSRKLILLRKGDCIAHLAGPLGIPLEIANYGTVYLAGGCYGIGAIKPLADGLHAAGNRVICVTESRSHYLGYHANKLAASCDGFIHTTCDGSNGVKGHALDYIKKRLEAGEKIDLVIAVGCPFMMMLTAEVTRPFEVKTLAALNPIMLDGTGMCGACRVTVGAKTKFACVDGPFFDAHQVDWEEVRDRRVAYSAEEIQSVGKSAAVTTHFEHVGGCGCSA